MSMEKPANSEKMISTSALAKKLGRESKDLFTLLQQQAWLVREQSQWRLSEKGKYQGGAYHQSSKFGEYVVWPESINTHSLFNGDYQQMLTVTQLAKPYSLSARRMNFILAELGWIRRFHHGWAITDLGKQQQGQQTEHENSGVPYTLWPDAVRQNAYFKQSIELINQPPMVEINSVAHYQCLNGLQVEQLSHAHIANWLYCAGINFAYQRSLPSVSEATSFCCDFYLPAKNIYIESWGSIKSAADIQAKLEKETHYKTLALQLIELQEAEISQLDDVLPKLLLQHDIDIY